MSLQDIWEKILHGDALTADEQTAWSRHFREDLPNAELIAKAPALAARVAELEAILRDIAQGAQMMLQVPLTPSFTRYVQEVLRVARQTP